MKRLLIFAILAVLLVGMVLPLSTFAQSQMPDPQTYTVMVGLENTHQGVSITAFFPSHVTIHAGDTVHWQLNTHEIHTVTFGYEQDAALPETLIGPVPGGPSPFLANPEVTNQVPFGGGAYTGGMANSGIMGPDEGEVQAFDLTFPDPGSYLYVCVVHGWIMSGTVEVVDADVAIPSPNQSMAMGQQEMAAARAQVQAVIHNAEAMEVAPMPGPDGTMIYTIQMGYMEGQTMLARFFPDKVVVRPGDTVVWEMTPFSAAPHTATFLNGNPAPPLFIAVPQTDQLPLLYVDLGTLVPSQPSPDLTREGFYNSGVLLPIPGTTYSLTIDDSMTPGLEPFLCLLHDDSGMVGNLMVVPR
jgi:plastocyanin